MIIGLGEKSTVFNSQPEIEPVLDSDLDSDSESKSGAVKAQLYWLFLVILMLLIKLSSNKKIRCY